MGLFDQIAGAVAGATGNANSGGNELLTAVMHMVNDPKTGGLEGLIKSFHKGGMAEIVNSWVSTGHNLPISAEQIKNVLGSDQVKGIASKLGINSDQASAQIAEYLPQIVDKLTPGGSIPAGSDLLAQGLNMLKGNLFK